MKHIRSFSILSIALLVVACTASEYDDSQIKKDIADLQQRMTDLETRVNSNIASLTEIVTALQQNDYLLSYSPYVEDRVQVGWQLNFAKSGSVIIYFGKDGENGKDGKDGENGKDGTPGKDGENGKDGVDGHTPLIGVRQDADGLWYWTLDGEWLLDASGAKVKAVGIDGKDGKDGVDGKDGKDGVDGKDGQDGLNGGRDGVDGKDGKDGITPLLKIEEGYWYLSLDNGQSWDNVGKATGENGKDGRDGVDGKDGIDGITIFQSVTEDDNYVYLILNDSTVITIPKSTVLAVVFNPAEHITLQTGIQTTISYEITSPLTPVKVEVVTSSNIQAKVIPSDNNGLSGTINVMPQSIIDEYSKIIVIIDNGEKVFTQSFTTDNGGLMYHEWVDLGLPSGVKWATCNVGASSPEEYGDYFAWGEIVPKSEYNWSTYKWCNGTDATITKYNTSVWDGTVDNKKRLEFADDAARANWGGSWRMPTHAEWMELNENCEWEWTSRNGIDGRLVTGPNGNSLFLPAAGSWHDTEIYPPMPFGSYWSSSLYKNSLSFDSEGYHVFLVQARSSGLTVRPVSDEGAVGPWLLETLDSDIAGTSVTLHASIDLSGMQCTDLQYGFCWGTSLSSLDNETSGADIEDNIYSATLTGLKPNTSYHFRAFVKYNGHVLYGDIYDFKTTESLEGKAYKDIYKGEQQYYQPGIVYAGAWSDFDNWPSLSVERWSAHADYWHYYPRTYVYVRTVDEEGAPVCGIKITLKKNGQDVWSAVSDNRGRAVLWANLYEEVFNSNSFYTSETAAYSVVISDVIYEEVTFTMQGISPRFNAYVVNQNPVQDAVDVAFIVDGTGSMGDELNFLKENVREIIKTVRQYNSTITFRTGAVIYGDDYQYGLQFSDTKYLPFTTNITETHNFFNNTSVYGGGDWPEAVDIALSTGLNSLNWNPDARSRLAFLILDAPPHHEEEIIASCQRSVEAYAAAGIKIIPIVASRIDCSTEYLVRCFALATNGTFVFIFDPNEEIPETAVSTISGAYSDSLKNIIVNKISDAAKVKNN